MDDERVSIEVEIDTESVEELEVVRCPVCATLDPFLTDDHEYQCQACGTIFVIVRGRQDLDD
jgi:DNA-directed RNA polymerase subunit RPC12/RpoP